MYTGPLDFFGNEMKVGDFIAYTYLLSRSSAIKVGKIIAIGLQGISVISVEQGWSGGYELKKKGTLKYPDRCIILHPQQVPSQITSLLAGENHVG